MNDTSTQTLVTQPQRSARTEERQEPLRSPSRDTHEVLYSSERVVCRRMSRRPGSAARAYHG